MNIIHMNTLSNFYIYQGDLILVNRKWPVSTDNGILRKNLVPSINDSIVLLEKRCALMFQRLLSACGGAAEIIPVSGYRSKVEQQQIYSESMRENGAAFTSKFVAPPNESEHQTGLAIDVAKNKESVDFICPDFPDEGACKTFRKLAPDFGFIERYQKGKEQITGIAHEPWHFRYVGYPHSVVMRDYNFCLEEYHDFLKNFLFNGKHFIIPNGKHQFEIYYYPILEASDKSIEISLHKPCQLSGNNADGLIVTVWY
ncbi:M15 family metallopeptidase [Candidatus Contubernalis alkaliaceticus]|uniref:M15 family metallopeptidase n=1 Tax=Candidatus Contubernalis alkaliaceticus TaxID=338645 RepID=UPI001F4BD60B|nr:M15 family metallopeptidase [Candidatus Contubernalis alkalaceticus]UNC93023.1 M15 family metallopeptidase [Candidatus Contubernalis alkalaceticus]